ncbi:sulfatase family protein [Thalassotalea crassostreae]|nr:arylsulfatase [Thalassotalea crassostreae]
MFNLKKLFIITTMAVISSTSFAVEKPNIVYILADDMGVGDVSALNPESKISTKYLDQLASEGVAFTDAHSGASVCTPTRYSLMTGRSSWRTELKGRVLGGYSPSMIAKDRDTVASLAKRHGYKTAMVGKWHLGLDWQAKEGKTIERTNGDTTVDFTKPITHGPLDLGFDYWFGPSASWNMAPYGYIENRLLTEVPTVTVKGSNYEFEPKEVQDAIAAGVKGKHLKPIKSKYPLTKWDGGAGVKGVTVVDAMPKLTEKAVEYINQQNKDEPFFLYMPLTAPHSPVTPNKEFLGKSKAGLYGDFVIETDWAVGQVVKALKEKGLYDNTLVVFTADNGTSIKGFPISLQEKYQHKTSYIYTSYKGRVQEGGHRVPFITSWPNGGVKAGTTSDAVISLDDLYATMADMFGEKIADNAGEDSVSMLPYLKDSSKTTTDRILVHQSFAGDLAIRMGDWKLSYLNKKNKTRLVNLKDDIGEQNNIIKDHPEKAEALRKTFAQVIRNGRSTPGKKQSNEGPEVWKQIEWIKAVK